MKCPICQKEVEESFEVPGNSMEPFTGVDAMKSLKAWGGYGVLRTVLCQQGEWTHFKFDHSGAEHLVQMVKFDQQALADRHEYHNEHPQRCEHIDESDQDEDHKEQCQELGIPCYFDWSNMEPDAWYCTEHAHNEGFCPGCGLYHAGTESFDFSPSGYCGQCQESFEDEVEDDDYDDEFEDDDFFEDIED